MKSETPTCHAAEIPEGELCTLSWLRHHNPDFGPRKILRILDEARVKPNFMLWPKREALDALRTYRLMCVYAPCTPGHRDVVKNGGAYGGRPGRGQIDREADAAMSKLEEALR